MYEHINSRSNGHIGRRRDINKRRDAREVDAERTTKRKGWQQSKGQLGHQGTPTTGMKEPVGAKFREGMLTKVVTPTTARRQQQKGSQHHKGHFQQQGPPEVFETWEAVRMSTAENLAKSINSSKNKSITRHQQQQRSSQQFGLKEANGSNNIGSGGQNDDFQPLTYTLGGRGMGCRDKYVTAWDPS
jgi:hypothetical protein